MPARLERPANSKPLANWKQSSCRSTRRFTSRIASPALPKQPLEFPHQFSQGAGPNVPCPPFESGREQSRRSCLGRRKTPTTDNSERGSSSAQPARYHVPVHLVRGDDQTGTRLLDFRALRRVQPNQKHVEPLDYHFHSSSSQRVAGASFKINWSSPRAAICRNASSQPARGG